MSTLGKRNVYITKLCRIIFLSSLIWDGVQIIPNSHCVTTIWRSKQTTIRSIVYVGSIYRSASYQTHNVDFLLIEWWATVCDGSPTFRQYRASSHWCSGIRESLYRAKLKGSICLLFKWADTAFWLCRAIHWIYSLQTWLSYGMSL